MLHFHNLGTLGRLTFLKASYAAFIRGVRVNLWIGILLGLLIIVTLLHLESAPPLWWDEGWTMNVAKNWVERGVYGQMLDGELQPPGLSAAFPVVSAVALSFRLLGVGIWQGRLPGVIYTVGAMLWIFLLADRLYGRKIAWTTLVFLLLMPFNDKLHPILLGRQVLGEMPALFYLLLGYLFIFQALRGRLVWLLPAAIVWAVALRTKAQVPPFWIASMLAAFAFTLYHRSKKGAVIIFLVSIGTWLAVQGIDWFQSELLSGITLPQIALDGYYSMSIMVPKLHIRMWASISGVAFGLPVIVGLIYAFYQSVRELRCSKLDLPEEIVRFSLLSLAGSWLVWYLLLAMYWPRFLFPSLFIGSVFASAMLVEFTASLDISGTIRQASAIFMTKRITRSSLQALAAVLITTWSLTISILIFSMSYPVLYNSSVVQAAEFINRETDTNALVESYESQLQFLVDRRWHYPPDQVHVSLNKRSLLDAHTLVDYDPLRADPDYLIVGPSGGEWKLYDTIVKSGEFSLIKEFPPYQIYERIR